MSKKTSSIDLDRLSPAVRAQLDNSPKPRGRRPGSKNRPKSKTYHGFQLGKVRGKHITFTYQGTPGQLVFVAGDFNGWNPEKKQLLAYGGTGEYSVRCILPIGRHEYKFVVDGEWLLDPANQNRVCNERGDWNNVLIVE